VSDNNYKITEIGIIPSDWNVVKIKDISEVKTGGTPSKSKPEYWNGDIKWMVSGDIHLKRVYDVPGRISKLGFENSNVKLLPKKTVMIALNGQGKTRGTVAILETELTCNQSLAGFTPSDKFVPEFLFYNLQSRYSEIRNLTGDGARNGLNLAILREIKVALPSLYEQRKIADILSSVDEAIEKTEAIIEQTEKVKKGLMQQLLTKGIGHTKFKKTEIGEIPEEWEVKTLGELLKLKGGFAFKSSDFVEKGDIPVLRISNIKNNYIDLSDAVYVTNEVANSLNEYLLRENDIVIAMSGATTGKIGRIEKKDIPVLLNQRVGLFKIYQESTLSNDFLYYFAQSKHFQSSVGLNAIGGAQPNISGKQIESVKIGLPSFEEQQQISLILSNIDKKLANEEQRLIQFQAIKKGLMQVLLTGKVRVKVDDEVVSS
jgi:type I restriction enzyme, S subunit